MQRVASPFFSSRCQLPPKRQLTGSRFKTSSLSLRQHGFWMKRTHPNPVYWARFSTQTRFFYGLQAPAHAFLFVRRWSRSLLHGRKLIKRCSIQLPLSFSAPLKGDYRVPISPSILPQLAGLDFSLSGSRPTLPSQAFSILARTTRLEGRHSGWRSGIASKGDPRDGVWLITRPCSMQTECARLARQSPFIAVRTVLIEPPPNLRKKLSWLGGRFKAKRFILIAAAAPRGVCVIR